MPNTPNGYPYPVGTDLVSGGDDVLQSLALAADSKAGQNASGRATVPAPAALNTPMSVTVVFPSGRFGGVNVPVGVATAEVGLPQRATVSVSTITAGGMVIYAARLAGPLDPTDVHWQAAYIP